MRRRGLSAETTEILFGGDVAKGLVGSVVVVSMSEGVDEGLELVDSMGQLVGGVELVSPARLSPFDATVEIGPLGRDIADQIAVGSGHHAVITNTSRVPSAAPAGFIPVVK